MADDIPLWYIRETIVEAINNGQGQIEIAAPLDMSDWPITPGDLVTEETVSRGEHSVTVVAQDQTQEKGVELRRRNATGGDYADIEQVIGIDATLTLVTDDAGDLIVPADDPGDIEFYCELTLRNHQSYAGERPPF